MRIFERKRERKREKTQRKKGGNRYIEKSGEIRKGSERSLVDA